MSESKYSPSVNVPENVPNRIEALTVMFLNSTLGQYVAFGARELMLYQAAPNEVALGIKTEKGFNALVIFPGTLSLEEKRIVEVG